MSEFLYYTQKHYEKKNFDEFWYRDRCDTGDLEDIDFRSGRMDAAGAQKLG